MLSLGPMTMFTNNLSSFDPLQNWKSNDDYLEREQLELEQEDQYSKILCTANFLFPSSLLEASLAILDDPSCNSSTAPSIRYLTATPSKRKIIVVRDYYCLIENDNVPDDSDNFNGCGFYYCSCRSFYERIKRHSKKTKFSLSNPKSQIRRDGNNEDVPVCKHILAALMAPFLLVLNRNSKVEITEEEYVELILKKSCGRII